MFLFSLKLTVLSMGAWLRFEPRLALSCLDLAADDSATLQDLKRVHTIGYSTCK